MDRLHKATGLVVPSSSGQIWNGVPALSTEMIAAAPELQQEARTPIDAARVAGKGKRKAISGWSIQDVSCWLKDEGLEQDICDKFISAPFSHSSRILHLHIRRTENHVNGELLVKLTSADLKSDIGIESLGKREEIMNLLNKRCSAGQCIAYRAELC
jgi:hypothetical protein